MRNDPRRMADDQHYDVIVIGTGAGGGTLAHRLAPAGKRVLLLERGDYLPRERDNWDSTAVFVKGKYRAPEFWYDQHGHEFPPEVNYYVGGQHQVLRRGAVPAAARRTSASCATTAGISPAWPIRLRGPGAVLHRGRAPLPGARPARRGPDRGPGERAVPRSRRSSTSRASSSSATTWRSRACTRSTCRSGSTSPRTSSGRATHASVCIRCDRVDGFPCLVNGKSDAQVICVDPALEHDNVALITNAHVLRLETDPTGRTVTQGGHHARGRLDRRLQRRRRRGRLRRGQLRGAAAALGQRPAPARAGQQLRRRRPALHAAQQPGADGGVEGAEPDPVPEDPRPPRLVPGSRRLGLPARRHPDARQVRRRADPQRRTALGRQGVAGDAVRGARPPRRRLLAVR